jgi:hypothetical protein
MIKELINCYVHNKITFPIYVLVDEYDHFANELISFNFTHFSEIVTANGMLESFMKYLK